MVCPADAADTWDEKFDVVAFRSQLVLPPPPPAPPDPLPVTTAVTADDAEALPQPFLAVTTERTVLPTSPAPSV